MKSSFQIPFYIIVGLCILSYILPSIYYDFMEIDTALKWTTQCFALPILVLMAPTCSLVYIKFLRPHEKKEYTSLVWTRLRTIFRIFTMTLGMTFILTGTTLSMILLTNACIGESKTITLNAQVIEYRITGEGFRKGKTKHHIKIQDPHFDRIIELEVNQAYEVGQTFTKPVKIGKWGLIYSENQ